MLDPRDLAISRHMSATPDQLWRIWSDPTLLAEWWCPKPWWTEVKAFDFRPGGVFHTELHGPDGEVHSLPGLFLELVPRQRMVFTTVLTEGWRPAAPHPMAMTGIFTMRPDGAGTFYEAKAIHADADTAKQHADMGFAEGWGAVAEQMEALARTQS